MKNTSAITAKGHFSTGAIERLMIAPRTMEETHIPRGVLTIANNLFPSSRADRIKYNFKKNCIFLFLTVLLLEEGLPQEGELFCRWLPIL